MPEVQKPVLGQRKEKELTVERLRELLEYDPEAGSFTWRVKRGSSKVGAVAGRADGHGYRQIQIDGHRHMAHRLAWLYMNESWPKDQIDHINGVRADNKWKNLREATNVINGQNRRGPQKGSVSGILGVSPDHSRWRAQIWVGGDRKSLGSFATPEEAQSAYLAAKRKLHEGCTI